MVDVGYTTHVVYKLIPLIVGCIDLIFDGTRAGGCSDLRRAVGGCAAGPIEITVGACKIQQAFLGMGLGHGRGAGCSGHLVRAADRTYGYAGSGDVYGEVEHVEGVGAFEPQLRLSGTRANLGVKQCVHRVIDTAKIYMVQLAKSRQRKCRAQSQCQKSFHVAVFFRVFIFNRL